MKQWKLKLLDQDIVIIINYDQYNSCQELI